MNKTMEEYIREAPDSIRNNIERRSFLTSGLSEKIAESGCHEICMVASGSSYNAALCALEGKFASLLHFTFWNMKKATQRLVIF